MVVRQHKTRGRIPGGISSLLPLGPWQPTPFQPTPSRPSQRLLHRDYSRHNAPLRGHAATSVNGLPLPCSEKFDPMAALGTFHCQRFALASSLFKLASPWNARDPGGLPVLIRMVSLAPIAALLCLLLLPWPQLGLQRASLRAVKP